MAHAEKVTDQIHITTQWNERELIKMVPGARWDPTAKIWWMPLSWSGCIVLRGVFGDALTVGDRLTAWAWDEKRSIDVLMEMRVKTESTMPEHLRDVQVPGLYPFQTVGATFLGSAEEVLLGDEMGTGKTIQALAAVSSYGDTLPALVVCPNSVKRGWAKESDTWKVGTPYLVTGNVTQRTKTLKLALQDPTAIVIVNYEALRGLTRLAPYGSTRLKRCRDCDKRNGEEGLKATQCQVHPKELNAFDFRTVIVDEAHRIKDPKSQQTRAVWAVSHGAGVRYRWALTGTPLANHPGDLWSILHCISPRDFPTKTNFVDRYCLQSWNAFGGLDIVGVNPAHREEFFKLLDPRFRRMPKAVVLSQLPPKVRSTRWVEMSPAQRKSYDQLEHGFVAATSSGVLVAPNTLIARLRQMQFSSASVKIEQGLTPENPLSWDIKLAEPSTKLDELEAVLDELGPKQVVICAQSRQLIDLSAERMRKRKVSYGLITGPVPEIERQIALERFQRGELQYLLFTVQAGGVGLTMTAADTIIFLQRSWSMIDNKQAEDRVHRIGSERHESIHVIDLVTRDSVEEGQIERLTEKFMRLQEIARDRQLMLTNSSTPAYNSTHLDQEEELILNSEL